MKEATGAFSRVRLLLPSLDRKKVSTAEFEQAALLEISHLYKSALCLTRSKTEAEDLVQETYLRAFRFFDKFQPGTNCRAWLLSILRNLFINRYQRKKREPEIVDLERIDQLYKSMVEQGEKERDNPEDQLISRLMGGEIEKALRELSEEFRMAIMLVDIEELSYEQASKVMECPIGTVRSRISRGRRMLQVALRGYALERGLI